MNAIEFDDWFVFHAARFTGLHSWLSKLPANPPPGMPGRKDVLDAWREALANVGLADAKRATERLFAGEEEKPASYDDHPRAIVRIAGRLHAEHYGSRRRYVDGQETYDCPLCEDEGVVWCWHPDAIKAVAGLTNANTGSPHALIAPYKTCVCCTCRRGDAQARGFRPRDPGSVQRYDEARCLRVGKTASGYPAGLDDPEERRRIEEFVAGFQRARVKSMPNYEPAFDGSF